MMELMMNMALCLVAALLIGFFVGWLFTKALVAEEYDMDYNELSSSEEEHNRQIKSLEQKYKKEKLLRTTEEKKNKELKFELMKKATLLKKLEKECSSGNSSESLDRLKKLLKEKDAELVEFESVLVKAEKTIEELRGEIKNG